MRRLVNLLNQKNHYLEKFYSLNETELLNFTRGDFNNLDYFYRTRENILDTVKYIDSEIDEVQKSQLEISLEEKREVHANLSIKEEYVNRILAQDLEILSCIEKAKSSIIRELQEIKKTYARRFVPRIWGRDPRSCRWCGFSSFHRFIDHRSAFLMVVAYPRLMVGIGELSA